MPSLLRMATRASIMLALLVVLLLCTARLASAGQGQDASIIGQVTDESGAVLPGVTVTASSPALQIQTITSVTNERGEYRLSPLPIGTYEVVYTLSGFQTVRQQNIRLTVGFVAKLDVSLKVGSLEESVTVSGQSPVVDVTSTSTTTQLTKETLELIPTTRNGLLSLMAQAPGVRGNLDVGGNNFSAVPAFHAYGQDGEQWSTLEGVLTFAPFGGYASGNYWDYTSFEETRVGAIGKTVEVPVRGVQMDAVVKSGGNEYHGGVFYGGTNHNFQSINIDDALRAQGINTPATLESQWDTNGDLGGRVLRDKLWFYTDVRRRSLAEDILGVVQEDGSPGVHTQGQKFHTEKGTFQLSPANRFVAFYQKGIKDEEANNVTTLIQWEARTQGHITTHTTKGEWQGVKGSMVASVQTGHWYYNADYFAHAGGKVASEDLDTLVQTGDSQQGDRQFFRNERWHTNGTFSMYKSDLFLGNHEFKSGFDYMAECCGIGGKVRRAGDYVQLFRSGVPFQLRTWNSPISPVSKGRYLATYFADNWAMSRRLTANVGARYARNPGFVPAQCREAGVFAPASCIDRVDFKTWNSIAPRISAAYDLSGRGKTVLKGGWGRYDHQRKLDRVADANPYSIVTSIYTWHDLNGDRVYQPGEVNIDPNGPDFVSSSGGSSGVPDPNEPQPKEDQYFASFEHELMPNFSVRVTGVYANFFNVQRRVRLLRPSDVYNIPITRPDPGPDGRVGTADDPAVSLTYYDYPAQFAGTKYELNMLTTPAGETNQTFKTIEIGATKRLTNRWHFLASYSATKKHIPVAENAFVDPNTVINTIDNTWEWIGRISGAYILPYQVTISANMENRSGDTGARTVLLSGGTRIPTLVVNAAPIGTLNLPAIRSLDLRAEKAFRLNKGQRLTARINVYNSLNANTVTSWTTRSGTAFKRATAILPARIFEVSASYAF